MSSTSSSSGPCPGLVGVGVARSRPRPPLFFKIIAPKSPLQAGPGRSPRPTAPHRSRFFPPARRLSPGPGAPARGHRRVWGDRAGAIRVRGSLPSPAVPAANPAWSDGRSRRGKNPWRAARAARVPRPSPRRVRPAEHSGGRRSAAKQLGGWAAPPGLRGARCRSRPGAGCTEGEGAPWPPGRVARLFQGRLAHPVLVR